MIVYVKAKKLILHISLLYFLDVFLPSPDDLLVNLNESREVSRNLLLNVMFIKLSMSYLSRSQRNSPEFTVMLNTSAVCNLMVVSNF